MRISTRLALPIVALCVFALSGTASAARLPLPHRAVYDLALVKASERSGISGVTGRMIYEFNGSVCLGYTTNTRIVTRIDSDTAGGLTDQQMTTFEDADSKSFSFMTKTYVDQALQKEVRGTAKREGQNVTVRLEKPEQQDFDIGPTQFPTQHILDLVNRADAGETFYETRQFDGADDGVKAMTTSILIGKNAQIDQKDPEVPALAKLARGRIWPIEMAYFDDSGKGGEEMPQMRLSFKLHETGITRDLAMDYGDFSLSGKLVKLEVLEMKSGICNKQ
ncbi:cell envelope integrity EipB family protein [Mesorhizobium sophorae]|uniref:cell envelope integrity EipB family protein n=1 Tax=Mesorhizobium sophorae TaxID=1300294 RepID=UPI000BA38E8E|nr:cell envelope integrity EipB family protein [Mesorhizobium sophorae]